MPRMKQTPYLEGDSDARVCIVGEAPGSVELALGRPLVGPSGKLFNELLHEAGLVRAELYIINLFDEQLERDREGKTLRDRTGDVVWSSRRGFTEHAESYLERFARRVAKSRANVFIALGGVPSEALTGKVGIGKWRGSLLPAVFPDIEGRTVISTYHPAAVLRGNWTWRYLIVNDFEKAARHQNNRKLTLPSRNIIIKPTYEDVRGFLREMDKGDYVATDIEITNQQISCISFSNTPSEAISIPFMRTMRRPYWGPETETKIWRMIARVLMNPDTMKVNQNILFDLHVLWFLNQIDYRGPLGDTMLAHHIIFPDFNKGLDLICSVTTDEPYYKDEGKTWKWVKDDGWEQFWRYNAKDAAVALEAWLNLEPLLAEEDYQQTYDLHIANYPYLLFIMDDGFALDEARFQYVDAKVDADLKALEEEFAAKADYVFNWGSSKQCKEYFYEHKGLKPYVSTKTRKPTVDDKALARIARRYNLHEARLIQAMRGLKKFKGSYLKLDFDADHRFRCSWNPRGTKNGRLSSSKTVFGTGSNMQNLPERFQDFLTVDPEV